MWDTIWMNVDEVQEMWDTVWVGMDEVRKCGKQGGWMRSGKMGSRAGGFG